MSGELNIKRTAKKDLQSGKAAGTGGGLTSVGLSMPVGFNVANSPLTTNGVIAVTTSLDGILKADGADIGVVVVGSGLNYDGTTLSANQNLQDGIISGGQVVWLHDYVYNVSPAVYVIDGSVYNSPSTDITLDPSSLTDDRIDLFVLTTSDTAIAITGTPSTPPVAPDYDANTQLLDSFATVDANTTEPTIVNDWIYQENIEWTTFASAVTINPNSTNNPYAGSKDVEGTNVANNQYITFTSPTTPNMGLYQNLIFEIRSKANWAKTKKWIIRWYNGTVAIGNAITFGQSSYGFVSTNTTTYQTITIPLADFGNISTATVLRITQSNNSGTTGWYLDNVQLQEAQGGGTPQTITLVTDVTGTGTNTISTTVVGIRNKSIPVLSAGNLKYTGSAWIFDNTSYLSTSLTNTHIFVGNVSNIATDVPMSGDATIANTGALTLATVNSNVGTFGDSTHVGQFTVNGKGLITSASNVAISASVPINTLLAATGTNTIDNTLYAQEWDWSTLSTQTALLLTGNAITTGKLLSLTTTSTAANAFTLLNIASSGANASASRTATAATISVTNTGTTSVNYGLNITSSGATTNYGFVTNASALNGIGTATPTALFQVAGGINISAANIINGSVINIPAQTVTDNSSSGSTGLQSFGIVNIGQPTIAASSSTTYTGNVATLQIANAPTNGTNMTLSGLKLALNIVAGASNLQGLTATTINGTTSITTAGAFTVTSPGTASVQSFAVAAGTAEVTFLSQYQTTQTTSYICGFWNKAQSQSAGSTTQNIGTLYGIVNELSTRASTATALGSAVAFQADFFQASTRTQKTTTVKLYNAAPLGSSSIDGTAGDQTVQVIATNGNFYAFYVDSSDDRTYQNAVGWGFYQKKSSANAMVNYFGGNCGFGLADLTSPTAQVHIGAGTATAGTAPLKFTSSGTGLTGLLTVAVAGTIEFTTYGLWMTDTAAARHKVWEGLIGASAPSTSALTAFINYYGTGGTVALSTPNTWITIVGDDGNTYKVPAYS